MYYDRGDHMIGQYNAIVDFYPLLKALLPRDSDRVEGRVRIFDHIYASTLTLHHSSDLA
jgi:hypothetical protein